MANPVMSPLPQIAITLSLVSDLPRILKLELLVTDSDSITELVQHGEGSDRNEYATCALRVGLLSLKHARGQFDVESVKREGDRMLADLKQALEVNRIQMNQSLGSSLREYFDPSSGKFSERVQRLI